VAVARHIAREAWYGLFSQALDKLLPVAIILYLARTLAPEQFGVYAFLTAYLAFFQIAVEQSLDPVLVRMISQASGDRVAIFQSALGLRILTAIVAAATAVVLGGPISGGTVPHDLTVLASLSLVSAMGGAYRAMFRGQLKIRAVLVVASIRAVCLLSSVVVAISVQPGLRALFLAIIGANLLTFTIVAIVMRSEAPVGVRRDMGVWRALVRGAAPLAVNSFALTVGLRASHVILMSMRGPVEVGLLGAASRVTEAFTILPEALMLTVYPLMANLHVRDKARLASTAGKSVRYLVMATGIPVVICAVAGGRVMGELFGDHFVQAGGALGILASMAMLSATGTVILYLLVAAHLETALYRNTLAFAAVNVALCFPLIRAHGYVGAAVAMVLTSAASQVSLALLPATRDYVKPCLMAALRTFGAVAVAVATLRMADFGDLVGSASAIVLYLLLLVVLGVLNREEVKFLRTMFGAFSRDAVG